MNLQVEFKSNDMSIPVEFKQTQVLTDGDYERGYAAGYEDGNTKGEQTADSLLTGEFVEVYNPRVTKLRSYALSYLTSLKKASFPNVKTGSTNVFLECSSLIELHLPNIETTGNYFVRGCSSLESVVFPKLEVIAANMFRGCSSLKRVDTSSVTTINTYGFYDCYAMEALVLRNDTVAKLAYTSSLGNSAFSEGTAFIYVPDHLVEKYKAATNWSTHAEQIKPISELEE